MKTNLKRLKLAKLIQLVSDITTDKGVLTLEGELEVGAEVFMVDSEGQLVPATDGEYETSDKIIVVSEGIVSEIREKNETPAEETVETPEEMEDENPEAEVAAEEVVEEAEEVVEEAVDTLDQIIADPLPVEEAPVEDVEDLKAKIAELEATIAELQEKLAGYEAKEEATEEPIEVLEKKTRKFSKVEERKGNAFRYLPRK